MRSLSIIELARIAAGFVTTWPTLRRAPYWPRERLEQWQLRRLQRLVAHAYESTTFYRSHYDHAGVKPGDIRTLADIRRLPIVTKEQVIEHYPHGMLAAGATPDSLIVSRSSGSTGRVLDIAYDSRAMVTFVLAGLRLYQMAFDYRPRDVQMYVYTSEYPLNSLFGLYPTRFVPTLAPIDTILNEWTAIRPALVVCYPSHLRSIVDAASDSGISLPRPKAVSVNSEMSTQAERDALAADIGCPVLDEYSSEELTRIAAQCSCKNYHVFEDINLVEILDDRGDPTDATGTLVGTNLHNFAMPMIRYRQNDLARIGPSTCPCGRTFRVLTDLQGRRNDSFTLPGGRTITSGVLLDATYEIVLTHRNAVRDFCLVQEGPVSVRLELVVGPSWGPNVDVWLRERFGALFGPKVAFRVDTVKECTKTTSGKRNPIINMTTRAPVIATPA